MSVSWPGRMRGPRAKTPLLLLLLLSALTGTVLSQSKDDGTEQSDVEVTSATDAHDDTKTSEAPQEVPDATTVQDLLQTIQGTSVGDTEGSGNNQNDTFDAEMGPTFSPENPEALNPIVVLIPVGLAVLIIIIIVCCIFISRKWKKNDKIEELNKEDPYLDGSATEKVPMPMFEEDVPSVLELEMEELGQWMHKEGETAEESANT